MFGITWGGVQVAANRKQVIWVQNLQNANTYYSFGLPPEVGPNGNPTSSFNSWMSNMTLGNGTDTIASVMINSNYDRMLFTDNSQNLSFYYWSSGVNTWNPSSGQPISLGMLSGFNSNGKMVRLSSDGTLVGVYGNNNSSYPTYQAFSWTNPAVVPSMVGSSPISITSSGYPSSLQYSFPVAMSSNGQIQILSGGQNNEAQGFYISYNYGNSWIPRTEGNGTYGANIAFILISQDGSYINFILNNPSSFIFQQYQSYTTTPSTVQVNSPFATADASQWPSAYPSGPSSIQSALDLIARFMNTNFNVAWKSQT